MSFNYKDSISSGNAHYQNQFKNDPGFRAHSKVHLKPIDTIETKQMRVEKHVLSQFQKNHAVAPLGKIVFVAKIGKYLILALILPPYYVLFEGPKWMILQVAPVIAMAGENLNAFFLLVFTSGSNIWTIVKNKIEILRKSKTFIKNKIENLQNFLQKIKEIFRPGPIVLPRFYLKERMLQVKKTLATYKAQMIVAMRNFPQIFYHFLKSKVKNFQEKISSGFKEVIYKVTKYFVPIANALDYGFEKVSSYVGKFFVKISMPFIKAFNATIIATKQFIAKLIAPIQTLIQFVEIEVYKFFSKPLRAVKNKSIEALNIATKMGRTIFTPIQNAILAITIPLQSNFFQMTAAVSRLSFNVFEKTGKLIDRIKSLGPPLKRILKLVFDESKKRGKQVFVKLKNFAKLNKEILKKGAILGLALIKKIPSLLARFYKKIKKWVIHAAKKIFLVLRLIMAWTKVLVLNSLENLELKK